MHTILKQVFFWFSALTALAGILGVFFLLDLPLYINLISLALLIFFAYDAITEYKKRKDEDGLES
ncbi:hypothetical protein R4Z10_12845 [Niallia sp. XMNu-256]|uniref:hypothetical protein n=1 Tax=Niallia sp. XMNu-256 TaxID=3082444 RepID=UPI0030D55243